MTLNDLKVREADLFKTYQSQFIEYGIALRDIREMCDNYSLPRLSEEVLIDTVARMYAEKEEKFYDLTKNEKHLMHIKAASELFKKEFATFTEVFDLVYNKNLQYTFEEANLLLKKSDMYKKIKPQTLIEVLEFIKLKFEEEVK